MSTVPFSTLKIRNTLTDQFKLFTVFTVYRYENLKLLYSDSQTCLASFLNNTTCSCFSDCYALSGFTISIWVLIIMSLSILSCNFRDYINPVVKVIFEKLAQGIRASEKAISRII